MHRCWVTPPADDLRVVNLLVCRIKLGLERNKSARLLLKMLRPKTLTLMKFIQDTLSPDCVDGDTLISEIESAVIERLLVHYVLGDRATPIHFLFETQFGGMKSWALNYVNALRRYNQTHLFVDDSSVDGLQDDRDYETRLRVLNAASTRGLVHDLPFGYDMNTEDEEKDEFSTDVAQALDIVNDGITLNIHEYRVLAFCLRNASTTAASPVRNLHVYLSTITGFNRSRVTRLYTNACRRLIEAVGRTKEYLAARGIEAPEGLAERRKQWAVGKAIHDSLTEPEASALLDTVAQGASVADACHAYGISDTYYYQLRSKYAALRDKTNGHTSTSDRPRNGNDGLPRQERIRR